MSCRGICERHRALKPQSGTRYEQGQRRCTVCDIFIWWGGLWCPCCGYRLRTRSPKGSARKERVAVAPRVR